MIILLTDPEDSNERRIHSFVYALHFSLIFIFKITGLGRPRQNAIRHSTPSLGLNSNIIGSNDDNIFYHPPHHSLDGFAPLLLPSMTTPSPEPASRAAPSPDLATKDSSPENRLGCVSKSLEQNNQME
jgi:hypothetical protein